MFNFFNQNTQPEEPVGLLNSFFEEYAKEEESPVVTVVNTVTTKVAITTPDATIEVEQTETTVTTASLAAFEDEDDDEAEDEGVFALDVKLISNDFTRPILATAIAAFCNQYYAKAEVVGVDGMIATVRFTSPLLSSMKTLAGAINEDEDSIFWMFL